MNSDYCNGIEMKRALERYDAEEALVIPIILRPVYWENAPFARLQVRPTNAKAVSKWLDRDEAYLDIVQGIRAAIDDLTGKGQNINPPTIMRNIPYERNPLFTGREDVLKRLHTALSAGKTTALTQPQAISGLGGIGKTQTAVEYAYRYQDDYNFILWIKAESRESIISDFVTTAHLLNLPEQLEQEQSRIVEAVKRWLQDNTGWLLIFDNADDLAMVQGFLPSGGKGHILLTTRAHATGRIAQRIEIAKMEQKEGALFLLHRTTLLDANASIKHAARADQQTAREIVQAMDGLPLALDQAGAFIEETRCSLSDYLQFFQTRQADLLQRRGRLATDHPDSVAATWSHSFENVQKANHAAAELLRLCAFLDPDGIQEEIITEGASELGPNLQPVAADLVKLNEVIGVLLIYSLVHRSQDHSLTVHRLVQIVLKHAMNKNMLRRWAERAVRAVNHAFPEVEYENWLHCQQFIPHVLACKTLIEQWDMAFPEAAQLLYNAGFYLRESAQYEQAEPLLQRALAIRESVLGPEHPDTATSLNNLAELYHSQGKYEQAEPLFQRALAIRERVLGPEHPDTANTLNNLASLYQDQGMYEQAEPLYQRAQAIRERRQNP
jgi:tetratricopeptide (TPR) repeat protein